MSPHLATVLLTTAIAAESAVTNNATGQSLDLGDLQTVVGTGLSYPLFVCSAPGEPTSTLYILEKGGKVRASILGALQTAPVLDLTALLYSDYERGLLGLVFSPDYAVTRQFYVLYSSRNQGSVIARYTMNVAAAGEPITADAASAFIVFRSGLTGVNHNGGCMRFGPDGLLYFALGDGQNDVSAVTVTSFFGKMLRIDVNGDDFPSDPLRNYRIPPGNPTLWPRTTGAAQQGLPEIWAIGLRNPWRWSFDRLTGDMWIGDVGEYLAEEVNFVVGNGGPGRYYGWPYFEGNLVHQTGGNPPPAASAVRPIYQYRQSADETLNGSAVSGGFVYRGSAIPGWRGRYFFGDYGSGRIWSFRNVDGAVSDFQRHNPHFVPFGARLSSITSLGEDTAGELYIVTFDSPQIRKIVPSALSNSLSIADIARSGGLPGPDGIVDGSDFITFINAFMADDLVADVVNSAGTRPPDDVVDAADFIAFVTAFAARR